MLAFLIVTTAVNFFAMPIFVLLPFYADLHLGKGAAWYGLLLAAIGAGSLVGYLGAGMLKVPPAKRPALIISALLTIGVLLATLGLTQTPYVALLLFFAVALRSKLYQSLNSTYVCSVVHLFPLSFHRKALHSQKENYTLTSSHAWK